MSADNYLHLTNIRDLWDVTPTCVCNHFYDQDALWRRTGLSRRITPTHGKSPASPVAG